MRNSISLKIKNKQCKDEIKNIKQLSGRWKSMSGTLPLRSLELIVFIIDTYILPLDAVELHKIFTDKELAYIAYLVRKYTKRQVI